MNGPHRTLGKYELIESLGHGGMAQVYKAYQPGLERFVAVKVMHPHLAKSSDFVERFRREARVVGQLNHAHIMRVIDFDIQENEYYLVMDYVQGGTLKSYLRQHGAMPSVQALPLVAQLTDALAYAHQRDMIHRDIKSDNILFLDERHSHLILTDFGIARLLTEVGLTMTGSMVGTPAYMSPEAVRGEHADVRSDIYSLGVVIYEMLTGRTPYVADTPYSMFMKQMNDPLPEPSEINPDVSETLNGLLLKALAKEPSERFQSAPELHAAIWEELAQTKTTPESPTLSATAAGFALSAAPATRTPEVVPQSVHGKTQQPAPQKSSHNQAPPKRGIPRWLYLVGAGLGVCLVAALMVFGVLGLGGADEDSQASEQEAAPVADLAEPVGLLQLLDNVDTRMGTLQVQIDDVSSPPDGQQYHLWMMGGDDTAPLKAGTLPVEAGLIDETYVTSQNILGTYSEALVTIEDAAADRNEPDLDSAVFRGALPAETLPPIRQLLVVGADTDKSLLGGAEDQALLAVEHGQMLQESLDEEDLPEARLHAEHIVNILDGEDGEHFGDIDRDGRPENPGDGFGVRRYLEAARTQAQQVAEPATTAEMLQIGADGVINTSERGLTVVDDAMQKALQFSAVDSIDEGQPVVDDLRAQLDALLTGTDEDGDGNINPVEEGTILSAYEFGTLMGSISLFAEE